MCDNCIFCKIAAGIIPSNEVYSNDKVYAFHDINPQAPIHVLVIPREHISSCDEVTSDNSSFVAAVFEAIPQIAKKVGLTNGYRVISNIGEDGCQSVKHMHFHILGGKNLGEQIV